MKTFRHSGHLLLIRICKDPFSSILTTETTRRIYIGQSRKVLARKRWINLEDERKEQDQSRQHRLGLGKVLERLRKKNERVWGTCTGGKQLREKDREEEVLERTSWRCGVHWDWNGDLWILLRIYNANYIGFYIFFLMFRIFFLWLWLCAQTGQ